MDQRIVIGPQGHVNCSWAPLNQTLKGDLETLTPVMKAFAGRNGTQPVDPSELEPYLTTAEQKAALQRILKGRAQKNSQ